MLYSDGRCCADHEQHAMPTVTIGTTAARRLTCTDGPFGALHRTCPMPTAPINCRRHRTVDTLWLSCSELNLALLFLVRSFILFWIVTGELFVLYYCYLINKVLFSIKKIPVRLEVRRVGKINFEVKSSGAGVLPHA
jgi:hypothetical protein